MKSLLNTRANIFYTKDERDPEKFNKVFEIVILAAGPGYDLSNNGELKKEIKVEEFRFAVLEDDIDKLIKDIETIRDAKEGDFQ